jgi:DNA-binding NarL/FixJ family response regulator
VFPVESAVEPNKRKIRVLVGDDSRTALLSVCGYLEFEGQFEIVGTAGDGLHVVHQAQRFRPDLVLTDLSMPRMTGLEATKELRKSFPELRILIITELSAPSLKAECLQSGADGFVEKNRMPEKLMEEVRRLFPVCAGRD